jgi:hypothetical protein
LGRVWWRAMRNTEEGWERGVGAGVVAGDAEYGGGLGKGCWGGCGGGRCGIRRRAGKGVLGAGSGGVGEGLEKGCLGRSMAVRTHCVAARREELGKGCRLGVGGSQNALRRSTSGKAGKRVSWRRLGGARRDLEGGVGAAIR